MPTSLLSRLDKEVLVGSGAIPTMLPKWGFDLGQCVAAWCVEHLDVIQEITRAYAKAGCDILLVNNASANRIRLKDFGLQDKAYEFALKLAKATREVAPSHCYLEGSLTNTGHFLAPAGDVTFEEVYEAYAEQVKALLEVGVDVFSTSCAEAEQARAAIKAVRDNCDLPIVARGSFKMGKRGFRTQSGLEPKTVAQKMEECGADLIGMSCGGTTLEQATLILQEMRPHCAKPLAARPNAGLPELGEVGAVSHPVTPEHMADQAPHWVSAGARVVAGCCGTTPEHMAQVVAAVKGKS